ncbi:hypothetical protein F5J12DRAFT_851076 [Pisolithus orientalis]|uniref:uncharacterized protein n=1 Tax=Pisolithus orientalis TaxID=936130 RepID=UPI00222470E8|nr:uncharacterized protein F5J12DRAFT_851076 [Pisolithus orientalis]KAI5997661.1 hypothetical protein F5J12DRAFT_851076 [Pisolithus orientalis]
MHTLPWHAGSLQPSISGVYLQIVAYPIFVETAHFYSVYFAIVAYMQSRIPDNVDSRKVVPSSAQPSVLPFMDPEMREGRFSISRGSSDFGPNTSNRSSHARPPLLPLILAQRQLTLPVQSQSVTPTNNPSPYRGPTPRRTLIHSIPAPLTTVAIPSSSRPSSNLQVGVVGLRPAVRHLSVTSSPRKSISSSEVGSFLITESPTARSLLCKLGPSYLM